MKHIFETGDGIEIVFADRRHRTVVERQIDDDTLLIYAPIEKARAVTVSENELMDIIYVIANNENSTYDVYSFEAVVSSREIHDQIPMFTIKKISPIKKIQRRDFYRLNIVKPLLIEKVDGDDSIEVLTKDISAGGLMAISPKPLEVNSDYIVYMNILPDAPVVLTARVLSSEPFESETRRYIARFYFKDVSKHIQGSMVRQINQMQAIEISRRRSNSKAYPTGVNEHIDDELLKQFNVDRRFDKYIRYIMIFEMLLLLLLIAFFVLSKPSLNWAPFFGVQDITSKKTANIDLIRLNVWISGILLIVSGGGLTLDRNHYMGRRRVNIFFLLMLFISICSLLYLLTVITLN